MAAICVALITGAYPIGSIVTAADTDEVEYRGVGWDASENKVKYEDKTASDVIAVESDTVDW